MLTSFIYLEFTAAKVKPAMQASKHSDMLYPTTQD